LADITKKRRARRKADLHCGVYLEPDDKNILDSAVDNSDADNQSQFLRRLIRQFKGIEGPFLISDVGIRPRK